MAKKKKIGIGINLVLPTEFSIRLDQHLLNLKSTGVRKAKSDYIIELTQIGFLHETLKK